MSQLQVRPECRNLQDSLFSKQNSQFNHLVLQLYGLYLYSLCMNYNQPESESSQFINSVRQSDQILRKLSQIKNAIQDNREPSPDNLNQYLPQERINSNQIHKRGEGSSNPQSYRKSLEKRLERLFKEERKIFNQSHQTQEVIGEPIKNLQTFNRFQSKDAFTVQRMEDKIKELEKKYLFSNNNSEEKGRRRQKEYQAQNIKAKRIKIQEPIEERGTPYKKTKSFYEKLQYIKPKDKLKSNKKEKIEQKTDQRLLTEISALKKQVRDIKESNVQINQRIQHKQNERKYKKQRSRYLLSCILAKLIEIQEEVRRRETKQKKIDKEVKPRSALEERQSLIHQNSALIKQVQQLGKKLRKQMSERERAEERSNWIENELRKLNRG